jgi:uncharacterized FlaG/YvyC family protein
MYKVRVENVCRCFLKSGMAENQEFDSQDRAKEEAQKMIDKMNSTFCQKHEFALNEQFGDYTIYIKDKR